MAQTKKAHHLRDTPQTSFSIVSLRISYQSGTNNLRGFPNVFMFPTKFYVGLKFSFMELVTRALLLKY
ncbi:hypothetical protein MADA3029_650136 [Vibrio nigripulchritudo MADA3029]|uniref:Uncharacterized protein n=1 Tax=Vibrio nigripulchritudo SOn1 TaxID=1238450 RepID=A0AAV2VTB9_9VIBR|nr:hypothetical protein VIBNIAM115_1310006 [Vibrio nigripulchritudo AM115]CCN44757.1 hypothetical protein VIBNIFTn2_90004 [Vibrio nigripulchritudo FTn2]CCN48604.1 hypothetical protein VIBNIMADA3020_60106 [Vibrio nigripulchritudo MADA3020]CCN55528.1 hypothetical protein VIBNIMADA3021_790064 [Vibrio nigripulchritudo MADA3021]CCN60812.1 hypothetical protein MADA3029_650136 [Vibrio nigripulchritudo MADA3029]CCN67222.1 hypothetical protein VIBNIPon4_720020 [Vibrio nigripulchritudo POn4]CCN71500.1 